MSELVAAAADGGGSDNNDDDAPIPTSHAVKRKRTSLALTSSDSIDACN